MASPAVARPFRLAIATNGSVVGFVKTFRVQSSKTPTATWRYEGTVFLVTHDHDVIEEVATRIWHFDHGKIEDFKGTYEEYTCDGIIGVAIRLMIVSC